jgi:hypothetical protein
MQFVLEVSAVERITIVIHTHECTLSSKLSVLLFLRTNNYYNKKHMNLELTHSYPSDNKGTVPLPATTCTIKEWFTWRKMTCMKKCLSSTIICMMGTGTLLWHPDLITSGE